MQADLFDCLHASPQHVTDTVFIFSLDNLCCTSTKKPTCIYRFGSPVRHKKVDKQAQNSEDYIALPVLPSPAGLQQLLAVIENCWGNLLRGHKCVRHKSKDKLLIKIPISSSSVGELKK